MKKLILAAILFAVPAQAETLLCLGDSLTAAGNPSVTGWCNYLRAARPEFTSYCFQGVNGRTSQQGVDVVNLAMSYCTTGTGTPYSAMTVMILLGTNDPERDAALTATRLREIARRVALVGATPRILTLPPRQPGGIPEPDDLFARDVGDELHRLNGIGPAYHVIPVRDLFTDYPWEDCVTDDVSGVPDPLGVHWYSRTCREAVGYYVAGELP